MRVIKDWINEFVEISDISVKDLAYTLSIRGIESEPFYIGQRVDNVVIAQITKLDKHPNADKLKICQANIGDKTLQIVTAAPNVYEGMILPLALEDAKLSNGLVIKKTKLRGIESFGMFCSKAEFGFEEESTGVWDLKDIASENDIGKSLFDIVQIKEGVVIEITPNRPDALSVYGLSREIAAIYNRELKKYDVTTYEVNSNISNPKVIIKQPKACKRYIYAIIKNVNIKESPLWLKEKLESIGVRSINNIVDITNYVLFEYNHPMHAFDLGKIGEYIEVDYAKDGEKFLALNEKNYTLDNSILTIRSNNSPIAIAGVIGGQESSISEATKDILLEVAYFDPVTVRKASKKLDVSTDSSYRFERGIDPNDVDIAAFRAIDLIKDIAGGELVELVDLYPEKVNKNRIEVDLELLRKRINIKISNEEIINILQRLGFEIEKLDSNILFVLAPTFRPDISIEEDIYEEVARIYGYENIPSDLPKGGASYFSEDDILDKKLYTLKKSFSTLGFYEVYGISLVSEKYTEGIYNYNNLSPIKLKNSLTVDMTTLRVSTIPTLLKIIKNNFSKQNENLRLFEIGYLYSSDTNNKDYLSNEILVLAGVMTGFRNYPNWAYSRNKVDIYDIKAVIEKIFEILELDENYKFVRTQVEVYDIAIDIIYRGKKIGTFGLLNANVLEKDFDITEEVYHFEIQLEQLVNTKVKKKFKQLPKYSISKRDVSFVVPKNIESAKVKEVIKKAGGKYLNLVEEVDYYESEKFGTNVRSITYRLYFVPEEKIFTDEELDFYFNNIIEKVRKDLNIEIRL